MSTGKPEDDSSCSSHYPIHSSKFLNCDGKWIAITVITDRSGILLRLLLPSRLLFLSLSAPRSTPSRFILSVSFPSTPARLRCYMNKASDALSIRRNTNPGISASFFTCSSAGRPVRHCSGTDPRPTTVVAQGVHDHNRGEFPITQNTRTEYTFLSNVCTLYHQA